MARESRLLTALVLALGLTSGVEAGPVADAATAVEAQMAAADFTAALAGADAMVAQVWDATPDIGIRQTLLVTEPAAGFGIYNPRPDEKFKVGEPILVYAEPFGFGYGSAGDGLYAIGFVVDLRILSESGEVLGDMPAIVNLDLNTRYKNREFQANLTYTLEGAPPGRYVLETTLHDKNSAKAGRFQNTIEIVE